MLNRVDCGVDEIAPARGPAPLVGASRPSKGLDVDVSGAGPVVVVRPMGELDIASAAALREALLTACARTSDKVVVDCTEVTFIDSTALGVLAACAKRLNASSHHLHLTHVPATVGRAIKLAGLTDFLGVQPATSPET